MVIYQENTYYIPETVAGDVYARQIIKNFEDIGVNVIRADSTNSIRITLKQQYIINEEELMRKYVEGGFKV